MLQGYLWALFLRKGGGKITEWFYRSGENIKTKVLVCKFALLVRGAGIPVPSVEEADILTELTGMEGEE